VEAAAPSTIGGQPFEGSDAQGVNARVTKGELIDGALPQLEGKKLGEAPARRGRA